NADQEQLLLFKADLAWGEQNLGRAIARLRQLYSSGNQTIREHITAHLETWFAFTSDWAEAIQSGQKFELPLLTDTPDLYWWSAQKGLDSVKAHALVDLGDA